ncbi:hypothetical protein D3C74_183700 [compost metagenome]
MNGDKVAFSSIDEYIALFTPDVQEKLQTLRKVIKEAAPGANEKIIYQMPTFALHGNLVHFAAYQNHIGFYPGASGISAFLDELSVYKNAKGSVQFPIDELPPYALITRIVQFRVAENIERADAKLKKKK